jgi:hypothetical protein
MFSALRAIPTPIRRAPIQLRTAATQAQRRAGDISDAFVSLSGQKFEPLSPEYAALKGRLIKGHESEVRESWERLLQNLREEIPTIVELGSKIIPEIDFKDLDNASETFSNELRKRGVAVVRGVVPEQEALQWKEDLREYIRQNPQTKGEHLNLRVWSIIINICTSFPCRQPTSVRAVLVKGAAPCPWNSEPTENAPVPHVLLA